MSLIPGPGGPLAGLETGAPDGPPASTAGPATVHGAYDKPPSFDQSPIKQHKYLLNSCKPIYTTYKENVLI